MPLNRIRLSLAVLLVAVLTFSAFLQAGAAPAAGPEVSAEDLVTQVRLAPRTPNILLFNQKVTVSFSYNTNEANGVRIFVRPFTGTALTPHYAACASPLYAAGTGTGSCTFTITSGAVTVNRLRFQMWDDSQTTLLFETFIPVSYQFKGNANIVRAISLAPTTPNIQWFGQKVTVRFAYRTTDPGGVRIWARPFSGSALTPNYAACASPIYPTGSGTGSCSFTITSGANVVSRIRFQMWNANRTVLLFEGFVPVSYQFKGNATMVSTIGLTPATPNILRLGQNVTVRFRYRTNQGRGVRIFVRPFTGGALTPNYLACASPLYPLGTGTGSCTFTITDGTVTVNRLRFQIWNSDQSVLIFEGFLPVHYQFR
ncbi:MAG: hypothetical protein ACM3QS_04190 [Bacteroidota bacterium]